MKDRTETLVDTFMAGFSGLHAHETEFLQAVQHVAQDVLTIEKANGVYTQARVPERLAEADRVIGFRVTWRDDAGAVQINRGWRVQQTNLLGP